MSSFFESIAEGWGSAVDGAASIVGEIGDGFSDGYDYFLSEDKSVDTSDGIQPSPVPVIRPESGGQYGRGIPTQPDSGLYRDEYGQVVAREKPKSGFLAAFNGGQVNWAMMGVFIAAAGLAYTILKGR